MKNKIALLLALFVVAFAAVGCSGGEKPADGAAGSVNQTEDGAARVNGMNEEGDRATK